MADSAASPVRVRILIAGSAELVRRGIRDVLARDRRFSVVGEVSRPQDLAKACLELAPDVIFLGLRREGSSGQERSAGLTVLRQTLQQNPFARVIVLVDGNTVEDLVEPVRAGAMGVLLPDVPASTLLEAVRTVLAGGGALDPSLNRTLFRHLAAGAGVPASDAPALTLDPAVLRALSPREGQVLRALTQGYRNKEIAAQLGVSVGTVKTHLRHIFRKLNAHDRTRAALTALQVRLPEAA